MTTALLPARKQKVTGVPRRGFGIIVGHPKSGKTEFATSFPNSYTLELELNGADRIEREARIHDILPQYDGEGQLVKSALDEFGDVLELAMGADDIETINIDTGDELVNWMMKDILKRRGIDPASPKAKEKDFEFWGELKDRIESMARFFKESGKLVQMVCHCRPPQKDETGKVIIPAGFNIPGQGAAYLAAQADYIGYVSKRIMGSRPVQFLSFSAPSDMAIWGSRIAELDGREIQVPRGKGYEAFAAMFLPAPVTKPAVLKPAPVKASANGKKK